MSVLSEYIANAELCPPVQLLPLMHSCECFDARNIIFADCLEATLCKVFKEKLLYFYYGKAAYPVGDKLELNRTDCQYAPVCFIVDFKKVPIYKIYPFDSGAYDNELYKNFFHRRMNIKEFEIPSNIESIQKYITTFFGDNQQYIDGQALPLNDTGNPYIDALISLLAVRGGEKIDERAHTIEVICNESLRLKDVVKCIVLPVNLLRDENISQYLKDNDIEYITYKVKPLVHPTKYYGVISEKVEEYIVLHEEVC